LFSGNTSVFEICYGIRNFEVLGVQYTPWF
jgi:hypothetical protein